MVALKKRTEACFSIQDALEATDDKFMKLHDTLKLGRAAELPHNVLESASESLQWEEQQAEALLLIKCKEVS